jgi:flagellar FliJ protein
MAKFRFRLETVLKHRERIEDERQRELAMKLREKMILLDQLRLMQQTISQSKRDLSDGLVGEVDLARVAQFTRYSAHVAQKAQAIVARVAGLEREIEIARQRLLDATKARKAMELLRQRHWERWQHEETRRETAQLDDLAVQRFGRQAVEVEP